MNTSTPPLPSSLAAAIGARLAENALELFDEGGRRAVMWFVRDTATPGDEAGVPALRDRINFGNISPGSLVGLIRTDELWSDYRRQAVPPGLYTLRYATQPVMKDHRGVSLHRDFLLLVPASSDPGPDAFPDQSLLIPLSRRAAGTGHPAVLALFPVPPGRNPGTLYRNPIGQWTVSVRVGATIMGLVLEGHGELPDQ